MEIVATLTTTAMVAIIGTGVTEIGGATTTGAEAGAEAGAEVAEEEEVVTISGQHLQLSMQQMLGSDDQYRDGSYARFFGLTRSRGGPFTEQSYLRLLILAQRQACWLTRLFVLNSLPCFLAFVVVVRGLKRIIQILNMHMTSCATHAVWHSRVAFLDPVERCEISFRRPWFS